MPFFVESARTENSRPLRSSPSDEEYWPVALYDTREAREGTRLEARALCSCHRGPCGPAYKNLSQAGTNHQQRSPSIKG